MEKNNICMSGILTKNMDRLPFANSGEKPIATCWAKYNPPEGHVNTLEKLLKSVNSKSISKSNDNEWIGYILNYGNRREIYYGHKDAVRHYLVYDKKTPPIVELVVYIPTKYLASR